MFRNQLINLISRPVFRIEEYITKLSKGELKDFIKYNYDYLYLLLKMRFIRFSV